MGPVRLAGLAALSLLAAMGCRERIPDPAEYLERSNRPDAGLYLSAETKPIRYELLQRTESWFLARKVQELGGITRRGQLDSAEAEVRERYGKGIYFVFTVRADAGAVDQATLASFVAYQNAFVQNPSAFVEDAVIVTGEGDSLRCNLAEPRMDRIHTYMASVFLAFPAPRGRPSLGKARLLIRNRGFWTEHVEFDLGGLDPRIIYVPGRNGLDA